MSHYHRTGLTTYPFSLLFLAAQTGVDPTVLRRVLAEFEKDGLISIGHNTVTIAQPEAFETNSCQCLYLAKQTTQVLEGMPRPCFRLLEWLP
jgi:DNA-binding transcriptional regulator YhcF (GntR family)